MIGKRKIGGVKGCPIRGDDEVVSRRVVNGGGIKGLGEKLTDVLVAIFV